MRQRRRLVIGLTMACTVAAVPTAGADSMLTTRRGDYRGWRDSYTLSNGVVEIVVASAIGPRILDFHHIGGDNVFYLRQSELGKTGEGDFVFRGGWRLWIAPEQRATTYAPDNQGCKVEELGPASIRVTGPGQLHAGIQKSIEVRLVENQPRARIVSKITNITDNTLNYAAWSLSVMRPGGRALVPMDVGDLTAFFDTRSLILWSYTKFADPRYAFGDRLVQIDQSKVQPALAAATGRRSDESKIGVDTAQGWAAYLRGDSLYVKRFKHEPGAPYADGGATVEIYSSAEFIEVENLGPLTELKPGESIVYPEEWSLFSGATVADDETGALRDLEPWLAKAPAVKE
ncbi:MAG TPA: hypothetical protein VL403_17235 [Candidatus Kryptonia bacterium]|nr:hypothetical protein [Candidatus Kryptonia bacterium]